jgi:hypothetical protein
MKVVNEAAPDWVKQHNAQKEKDAAKEQEQMRRSVEAGALYLAKGPEVWQRFVSALGHQASFLEKLDGEELFGSRTPIGKPGGPMSCQVNVERRSVSRGPKLIRVVFHYDSAGTNAIRVTSDRGEESPQRLGIDPDNNVGFLYHDKLYSPEEMAETVIRQLADTARRP